MENRCIENEFCRVIISNKGAEVHSMIDKSTGIDYIWCGNPEHWANRNPVLFPHMGSLPGKKYIYEGKEYTTGNHGIARYAMFTWVDSKDNYAELILESNDELKTNSYPFEFALRVRYELEGKRLNIKYTIENRDTKALPFEIGMHPAFNVPMVPGKCFEDYSLVFEVEENTSASIKDGVVKLCGNRIDFSGRPFDKTASMFFPGLKSKYVTLTDGENSLRVCIEDTAVTGFWRPTTAAPFVCIEPWRPFNNLEKEDTFKRGNDNWLLPSGESFKYSYYFEII